MVLRLLTLAAILTIQLPAAPEEAQTPDDCDGLRHHQRRCAGDFMVLRKGFVG